MLERSAMKRVGSALATLIAGISSFSCGDQLAPDTVAGVSWTLASYRAATISDLRYDLSFSIPVSLDDPVRGHSVIHLILADASHPLVLDFEAPAENVVSVRIGDRDATHELTNGHIVIAPESLTTGQLAVEIEFIAGEASLNRRPDYLYALFVPDRARLAFPCFDQPNLKGRYNLRLEVPATWEAVANGPVESREVDGETAEYVFAETKPISTYVFAFAAGAFKVESAERGGRELHMYHRETDSTRVERNRDAIFDLHAAALDWLESYTGIAYPFAKFDFVLIPAFQFGGMEHPGAILYRDAWLLLDESATRDDVLRRASLIAHEVAHMWFGDLVTMEWFNDVWTKEVFANFMAAKIINPSFPELDHELRFLLAHYPQAYEVDRTPGANSIRQELDNMNDAASLYGSIIYRKAPVVMKMLERLTGEDAFREGMREYLTTFEYANATWPDLIEILDRQTRIDLVSWSDAWVEEPRRPTIRTSIERDAEGNIAGLSLAQSDPAGAGRLWSQRLNVMLSYPHTTRSLPVQLDSEGVDVDGAIGLPAPDFVVANGAGLGYGLFELDGASMEYLLENLPALEGGLVRGIAWLTVWDAMLEGQIDPGSIIDLALAMLATERDELIIQRVLSDLEAAYWRYLPQSMRDRRAPDIESFLWSLVEGATLPGQKSTYFETYRAVAVTGQALERLRLLWRGELEFEGLSLSERDDTEIALLLSIHEVHDADQILDEQFDRIENPDRRDQLMFVRPAASADPLQRERFFESLADEANREHEPWVLEGLRLLHHPLRAASSEPYVSRSLEMLEDIKRTGDIFFPKRWLDATLSGHSSMAAARTVCTFLVENPGYPPRLRQKVQQSADPLFRAASILHGFDAGDCQ